MSYNIRLGIQEGVSAIARVINAHAPDIVSLQEVGKYWRMGPADDTLKQISDRCEFEHFYYVPTIHEPPEFRYGHGLLSRWPIESTEIFSFSQVIDEPRAALIAHLSTPDLPGGTCSIISTHLSHLDEERARQGAELLNLVDSLKPPAILGPLILLGDLNEIVDAPWMQTLSATMQNAAQVDDNPTFPNPTPQRRIDHILVRGGQFQAVQILNEPTASDHRPLLATISFD